MVMGDPRQGTGLHQFPQPTRPLFSYDTIPDRSLLPEEKDPQEYHHPEMLELPKPSRPMGIAGDDVGFESHPCPPHDKLEDQFRDVEPPGPHARFAEPVRSYDTSSEQVTSSSEDRVHLSPSTGKTPKGEKEAVDELLLILIECMEEVNTRSRELLLRKFFSDIERDERLEKFIVERLRQSKVKAVSELREKLPASVGGQLNSDGESDDSVSTRSLHESVEELTEKLERFKVKTLALGDVVNAEEKK